MEFKYASQFPHVAHSIHNVILPLGPKEGHNPPLCKELGACSQRKQLEGSSPRWRFTCWGSLLFWERTWPLPVTMESDSNYTWPTPCISCSFCRKRQSQEMLAWFMQQIKEPSNALSFLPPSPELQINVYRRVGTLTKWTSLTRCFGSQHLSPSLPIPLREKGLLFCLCSSPFSEKQFALLRQGRWGWPHVAGQTEKNEVCLPNSVSQTTSHLSKNDPEYMWTCHSRDLTPHPLVLISTGNSKNLLAAQTSDNAHILENCYLRPPSNPHSYRKATAQLKA